MAERFPPPWTVRANPDCYWIEDANGHRVAFVYFRNTASIGSQSGLMSQDSARRIASNIARLPDLIKRRSEARPTPPEADVPTWRKAWGKGED